ncbi:hypothetical protein Bbelb_002630, partial [Branchiostoma belcheri]
ARRGEGCGMHRVVDRGLSDNAAAEANRSHCKQAALSVNKECHNPFNRRPGLFSYGHGSANPRQQVFLPDLEVSQTSTTGGKTRQGVTFLNLSSLDPAPFKGTHNAPCNRPVQSLITANMAPSSSTKYLNGDAERDDGVEFKKSGGLSTREVILIVVLIIVTVAGVVAIAVLASQKASSASEEVEFCNTRECASTAGFLIDNMDPDVDPCENFFEFAVGGWKKNNPIPDTSSSWSMYSVLRERVQYIVRDILEEPTADDEIEAVKKAKDVYRSCMDLERDQTLTDFLNGPLQWPVIDANFDESKFDILATMLALRAYNNDIFIEASVSVDSKNSSLRIITVDQPSLGLGRDYYIDENYARQKQAYFELMVSAATALGANASTVREEMNKTLALETFLAEYCLAF